MKKYIVEEIENGIAKCENEDGDFELIKVSSLPTNVKDGDVLICEDGVFNICESETLARKKMMLELQNKLFGIK